MKGGRRLLPTINTAAQPDEPGATALAVPAVTARRRLKKGKGGKFKLGSLSFGFEVKFMLNFDPTGDGFSLLDDTMACVAQIGPHGGKRTR